MVTMTIGASSTAVQLATSRANFAISAIKQNAQSQADIASLLVQSAEAGQVTATRGNNLNIVV